MGFNSGFKGLM